MGANTGLDGTRHQEAIKYKDNFIAKGEVKEKTVIKKATGEAGRVRRNTERRPDQRPHV